MRAHCYCLAGVKGTCKHVKALVEFVNNHNDTSMDWCPTTKVQSWGTKKKEDPTKSILVVGGIVAEKEWKNQHRFVPVDTSPLLAKHLKDSDSPLMQFMKNKKV